MLGLRGSFGLVLTTGDVLRITCITALHESPHGVIRHGRRSTISAPPVSGATMATVNLAHIVTAVEFVVADPLAETRERSTSPSAV
jgi:hypothetical protein